MAFGLSFTVGIIIATIPYVYEFIENSRSQISNQKQKQLQIQIKEKVCKNNNSDYIKFLNLGFPETATEKFNICMQEQ